MDINYEYKSNNNSGNSQKPDERVIEPVAQGVKKKKGIGSELVKSDIGSVGSYIMSDILIPSLKKLLSESFTNGLNMILWGDSAAKKGSNNYTGSRIEPSYRPYYQQGTEPRRSNGLYSFENVSFNSAQAAKDVLMAMVNTLETYGTVKVSDLYDFSGVAKGSWTDNSYGWTDLRTATVERAWDGSYYIKLPKALAL